MLVSVSMLTFSVLDWKHPFWEKFDPKNQNCHFKWKFGTLTNWNMQISMVTFIAHVFYFKMQISFLGKLVQKIKILNLI